MKWIAQGVDQGRLHCVIERQIFRDLKNLTVQDGFYLYLYRGDFCIQDYLQDTLESVMEQAFKNYGILKPAWKKEADKEGRWSADTPNPISLSFEIMSDPGNKYSLRVLKDGSTLYNHQQQTFDKAKAFALKKFGIPEDAWRQADQT